MVKQQFKQRHAFLRISRIIYRLLCCSFRYRAACVAVKDDGTTGHLVLLVSSSKHRNRWSFPAGGLEAGETKEEAARRELTEEAGCTGVLGDMIGTVIDRRKKTFTYVFALTVTEELQQWHEGDLGRKRRWVRLSELFQAVGHKPTARKIVQLYRAARPDLDIPIPDDVSSLAEFAPLPSEDSATVASQ